MFVLVVVLVSCSKQIPEGDIRDFVEQFDYELAYSSVQTAISKTTVQHFENSQVDGTLEMNIEVDTQANYHYSDSKVSGYFYGYQEGQYSFQSQQTLCYLADESTAKVFRKTDGTSDDVKYSPEDVMVSIHNFFYTELEAGIYRGGFYYGDYVRLNCAKYYDLFSLNEDKTELTYSINTVTQDKDGTDILNMHSFTINQYGMLIELSSVAKNNTKKLKTETTVVIEYNVNLNKLLEL